MSNTNKELKLTISFKKIFYFLFLAETRKFQVIALAFISIAMGIIPTIDSILLKNFTELIETYGSVNNFEITTTLFLWTVIYAVWWEALNISWRLYDYLYLSVIPAIKAKVIDELYDGVQYHSSNFFQVNMSGDITNRITSAATSLEMIFDYTFTKIGKKFAMMIFALITLFYVHITIGIVFFIWIILLTSASVFFANKINSLSLKAAKQRANVAGRIVDSISNVSVIRMFTSHRYERKFLNVHLNKMIGSEKDLHIFLMKFRYLLGTCTSIMIFCIIFFILKLRSHNEITIGECVLIITLCISVVDHVWDLTQEFGDLFNEIGIFNIALTIIETDMIQDHRDAIEVDFQSIEIEFKNVTFNYKKTNNNNIFKNKNVYIPAKQRIGLAGFSGSGKSTFAKLIARLYEIDEGEILINGIDIRNIKQESLRKHISIIPQEPILFHRNILDNIQYGSEHASFDDVVKAAKSAHIHDEIISMEKGYYSSCGERGNNLSGGQKQRIIIARAFLKNAPILILDEATSALDTHTEKLIQKSIENLMIEKTVVVIAHRLNTLKNMNRILVFDKGNIVEDGNHDSLKNNAKLYQTLWESQVNESQVS